jgi:hypothetical protein
MDEITSIINFYSQFIGELGLKTRALSIGFILQYSNTAGHTEIHA